MFTLRQNNGYISAMSPMQSATLNVGSTSSSFRKSMRKSVQNVMRLELTKEELILDWCKGDLQTEILQIAAWVAEIELVDFVNNKKLTNVSIGGNKSTIERMVYLLVLLCVYAEDGERSEVLNKVLEINLIARNRGEYILRLDPKILNAIQFDNFKEVKPFIAITMELLNKNKAFMGLMSKAIHQYEKAEFGAINKESFARNLLRRSL